MEKKFQQASQEHNHIRTQSHKNTKFCMENPSVQRAKLRGSFEKYPL